MSFLSFDIGVPHSIGASGHRPPTSDSRIKDRLNQLIRAHNELVEETKQVHVSLEVLEGFEKAQHDQLDERLTVFMRQQYAEMDTLKARMDRMEESINTLCHELLSIARLSIDRLSASDSAQSPLPPQTTKK